MRVRAAYGNGEAGTPTNPSSREGAGDGSESGDATRSACNRVIGVVFRRAAPQSVRVRAAYGNGEAGTPTNPSSREGAGDMCIMRRASGLAAGRAVRAWRVLRKGLGGADRPEPSRRPFPGRGCRRPAVRFGACASCGVRVVLRLAVRCGRGGFCGRAWVAPTAPNRRPHDRGRLLRQQQRCVRR